MFKLIYFISFVAVLQANAIWTTDGFLNNSGINYGTDASLNETKFQVSIRTRREESFHFGFGHTCGGSLISNNVVLTAAHCFLDPDGHVSYYAEEKFVVVMGNLDRFEYNNNTLVFNILKIVKGSFNVKTNDEDIALVFLNGTVPADHPTVEPVTLNEQRPIQNKTICQVTGWGFTDVNEYSQMLRTVDLPIIDLDDCRNENVYGLHIREGMLCAGYLEGGPNVCRGDSGSPLVCRGIQAGILSWSYSCGWPVRPSVSTDVAFYKEWILKVISQQNGSYPEFGSIPDEATVLGCSMFLIVSMSILNVLHIAMNE